VRGEDHEVRGRVDYAHRSRRRAFCEGGGEESPHLTIQYNYTSKENRESSLEFYQGIEQEVQGKIEPAHNDFDDRERVGGER
jgi:hypothetical protein